MWHLVFLRNVSLPGKTIYAAATKDKEKENSMANNENTNSKNVQGFVTVILRLMERWDEIWQVHRKNPVVPKNEPEKEKKAEG